MSYNFKITGGTRYVSKSGNDSWDGSRDFPKATIGGAISGTTNANATIIIVGTGVYEEVFTLGNRFLYGDGNVIVRGNGSNSLGTIGGNAIINDIRFENLLTINNSALNGVIFNRCTFFSPFSSYSIATASGNYTRFNFCKFINANLPVTTGDNVFGVELVNCDVINSEITGVVNSENCYLNGASFITTRPGGSGKVLRNHNIMGSIALLLVGEGTSGVIQDINGNYYDLSIAGSGGDGGVSTPYQRNNTSGKYFTLANSLLAYPTRHPGSFNKSPNFNNSTYLDLTLKPNSPHINAGFSGVNIGSSVVAKSYYNAISTEMLTANGAVISNLSGTSDLTVTTGNEGYHITAPIFNSSNPQAVGLIYIGNLAFNKSKTGGTADNTNVPDSSLYTNIVKSATTVNTSTDVTIDTTGLAVGMSVSGTGIPVNTSISAISSGTITISNAATASATNNLTFVPAGNNPDRLTFLCRWATGDTAPVTDTGWDNGGLFTAGEYQSFMYSLNANQITYMSIDSAGRTNGNPAFDWSTAMDIGMTYYQVKTVLRNNYTN